MVIQLNEELTNKIKTTGNIKTKDVIDYILHNVPNTSTNKPLMDTSLSDISFDGLYPKSGNIDTLTGQLYLSF